MINWRKLYKSYFIFFISLMINSIIQIKTWLDQILMVLPVSIFKMSSSWFTFQLHSPNLSMPNCILYLLSCEYLWLCWQIYFMRSWSCHWCHRQHLSTYWRWAEKQRWGSHWSILIFLSLCSIYLWFSH